MIFNVFTCFFVYVAGWLASVGIAMLPDPDALDRTAAIIL